MSTCNFGSLGTVFRFMAVNQSLATSNSNYNELPTKEKKGLSLTSSGETAIVREKDKIRGLDLKTTKETKGFELKKGVFSLFEFKGGDGPDSLTVAKKAKVRGGSIDLGGGSAFDKSDGVKDVIQADNKGGLKGVNIKNFGYNDELKIAGKTYTGKDVKEGKISGLDGITFNNN